MLSRMWQGYQFCFILFEMTETFHINLKNGTKRNNFYMILNLGPFRIFRLNFGRNVPVSFHMFCSALEKPLNQIEPCSI
jgi:D-alanyl-lipoteichoic acid acyltransferase DltB (MBOAT superfamily)